MRAHRPSHFAFLVAPALAAALLVVAGRPAGAVKASDAELEQGREIAEASCSGCHAIGRSGESPLAGAPAFRTLGQLYPVENLEEALAEGIVTGHPDMPEVAWDPDTITLFLAYLKSIQVSPAE